MADNLYVMDWKSKKLSDAPLFAFSGNKKDSKGPAWDGLRIHAVSPKEFRSFSKDLVTKKGVSLLMPHPVAKKHFAKGTKVDQITIYYRSIEHPESLEPGHGQMTLLGLKVLSSEIADDPIKVQGKMLEFFQRWGRDHDFGVGGMSVTHAVVCSVDRGGKDFG